MPRPRLGPERGPIVRAFAVKMHDNACQDFKRATLSKKLDDGWPESVEEQGLLLLVRRHHIRRQYIQDVL